MLKIISRKISNIFLVRHEMKLQRSSKIQLKKNVNKREKNILSYFVHEGKKQMHIAMRVSVNDGRPKIALP